MRRLAVLGALLAVALGAAPATAQMLVAVVGQTGVAEPEERLARIDLATGVLTLVGSDLGLALRRQGSGYDPATGRIYFQALAHGEADPAPDRIWTVDVATGAVLANPQVTVPAGFDDLTAISRSTAATPSSTGSFDGRQTTIGRCSRSTRRRAAPRCSVLHRYRPRRTGNVGARPGFRRVPLHRHEDGAASASEQRIWSVDLETGNLLNAPPLIAPPDSYDPRANFATFDPASGRLLLLLFDATPSRQLVSLSPTTGVASAVGSPLAIDSVSAGVSALDATTGLLAFIGRPQGGSEFLLFQVNSSSGSVIAMPAIVPPGGSSLSTFPAYLEFVPEPGSGGTVVAALCALAVLLAARSPARRSASSPRWPRRTALRIGPAIG